MSWIRTSFLIIAAHPSAAGYMISQSNGLATVVAGPVRGLHEGHRFDGVVHGCRRLLFRIVNPPHDARHCSNKRVWEPASLNLYRIPRRRVYPIERTKFHFIGLALRVVHEQTHFCKDRALGPF